MPSAGGAAGKVGDQYEVLWAVDAALRIIGGHAEQVTYESLDPEASLGVEFNLQTVTGDVEFWSVKRQTAAAAGWTLALLTRADEHGRSILGDLVKHTEREDRNLAVFASTLGAAKLEELRAVAGSADTLQQRLGQSAGLSADFDKYLLPLFGGDTNRACRFLTRLQIRTADEASFRTRLESTISLLFYNENGSPTDAADIRRLLAEFLFDHMHMQIDRKMLLDHLAANGIRRRDWKLDNTVREKVDALCDAYTTPLNEQLVGGTLQTLPGADQILGSDSLPNARWTLITGGAGGGKSTESAHIVKRLRAAGIPTLPLRMDQIDESVLTPQRLGEALSIPASPVAVLAGIADGGNCVLVVDQLDAVSLASGRRAEVWSLFEHIRTEVLGYPNMRIVVACREFDLEHDHRMRTLKDKSSAFEIITLEPFDPETVVEILGDRRVHAKLKPLLVVPLHLAMFLSLTPEDSEDLETRDQLFAAFWVEKQRKASQRLGRACDFAGVVDRLARWLSDHQDLSAPEHVLDDVRVDADALASEHVLVLTDGRYRFFHETFFDYAFARRFSQAGGHLLDLLLSGEQHLFRRAQVRQVLSFLRSNDPTQYIGELRTVLGDDRVRFHIKRLIFQYLATVAEPTQPEWIMLRDFATKYPELRGHVHNAISNHTGWFDTVDSSGFFDSELACGDTQREQQAIWFCAMPKIMERRSGRVAELLVRHRRNDTAWPDYLQHVCRNGDVYHSREMFELFLLLICDGTLDGTRPGFAVNDNWWSTLYSMADKAPELTSEAIAAWFDRKLFVWRQQVTGLQLPDAGTGEGSSDSDEHDIAVAQTLRDLLDADGGDHSVVANAAKSPLVFAEQLLPRVASFVAEQAKPFHDQLDIDPLWSFRSFGDKGFRAYELILSNLALSLERLAQESPPDLDRLFAPYLDRPHDTITYLVLRAWTAAPDMYAEQLAQYLAEDPRRLKVGYGSWSGNAGAGVASGYRSIEAVRVSSTRCSLVSLTALEQAIVNLQDEWESREPRWRGLQRLQLLDAMGQDRLGDDGRAKLSELQRKFPDVTQEPPTPMSVSFVGSPIPAAALEKMTDDQWLGAMTKYAGVEHRHDRAISESGGERQLAQALESSVKADPKRFIALAVKMPANLPGSYFDAILRGIADTPPPDDSNESALSVSDVVPLVQKVHTLPKRPCGRSIAWLLGKWSAVGWPEPVIDIIAWHAVYDPNPTEELWQKQASGGECYYGGDPDMAGLNSNRGAAADAIARLLFEKQEPLDVLVAAVDRLAHDAMIAVRSQAIHCLLALLNIRPDLAIPWFIDCVSADQVLLKTRLVERFLYHAGYRDYAAIQPVLQSMLASCDDEVVASGARLCCLFALDEEAANEDAACVRNGNLVMRKAAATVYATNVANQEVGAVCRDLLLPLFVDAEDAVQSEAATAFRHIADLDTPEQGKLLAAFLDAAPGAEALEPVIRELEDSPVRLPDLVCRLVEAGIEAFKTDASDIRTGGSMVARDLSKIVIRLYTQSDDEAIRRRCLDSIDVMEQHGFFGLSDELGQIDR